MNDEDILRIDKAAEMLDMHPVTLRAKAKNGEVPACKVGSKWLFIRIDLLNFIRSKYASKKQEEKVCHSTNAKIHHIGGSKSRNQTADLYIKALEPKTRKKLKNSMTN